MSGEPFYGWYGDDFTGATDTLATLAERGVSGFLFLGVPSPKHLQQAGLLQAIGIAGSARSMSPGAMVRELEPVAAFFAQAGTRLVHYKCCSTFDSAPQVGNLVTAVEVLRSFGARQQVVVVGGQPSLGRFCVFGNLFASAGQGGDIHRIDRHPTMSRHPVTPMAEADLRHHLRALGAAEVDLLTWTELSASGAPSFDEKSPYLLLDALDEDHIERIGALLRQRIGAGPPQVVLGASSVAQAMFPRVEREPSDDVPRSGGPTLAIAGSLSPLTRVQVSAATRYERIAVPLEGMISDEACRETVVSRAGRLLRDGTNVLVTTAPDDADPRTADPELASATGRLVDRILKAAPVRRILVAGGDTSSQVVASLGIWGLSSAGFLAPGVALSRSRSDDPLRDGLCLLLKGGQMGDHTLFDRFVE